MTSVVTVKREVEKLRQMTKPKRADVVVVRMWRPDACMHAASSRSLIVCLTDS